MPTAESSHREPSQAASQALGQAPAVWPLGRMMLVVFAVCLAVWASVIAYVVH